MSLLPYSVNPIGVYYSIYILAMLGVIMDNTYMQNLHFTQHIFTLIINHQEEFIRKSSMYYGCSGT